MTDGVPIGKVPEEAEEGRTKRQGDERKPTFRQGVGGTEVQGQGDLEGERREAEVVHQINSFFSLNRKLVICGDW